MANNYDVNYNDSRFTEVETDKKAAINEIDKTYGNMISQSDKYYQDQIDASQKWADEQTKLQNEQTDFAIEKIEQQKAQAKTDYTKEQSGAYVDWQKQSNQYGANAEQMAAQGMTNTGYSESSQVSMYNTYQNRVATARESYNRAVLNYDNSITEARLQNNAALAEIAYQALEKQLELSLQGFQYKNTLLLEKANKKLEVDQMYYQRYQDVLSQINHENAMKEDIRQYNESLALQKAQLAEEIRQFDILHPANTVNNNNTGGSINKSRGSSSGKKTTKSTQKASVSSLKVGSGSSKNEKNTTSLLLDNKTVLNLGQGPISGANLAKQVNEGRVSASIANGKIGVKYTNPTNKLLYSKSGF